MNKEELIRLITNPELLNEETLPQIKELVVDFPYFQSAWLLLLRNLKNISSPEFTDSLRSAAPRISDRRLLYLYLHPERVTAESPFLKTRKEKFHPVHEFDFSRFTDVKSAGDPLDKRTRMIDDFLRNRSDIRFQRPADNESREDLSESSASEHDDFLTETLAEIFVGQKKFKKAIESFEKLSLKFPEKSIYFAARIEEIKSLLNN